MDYEIRSDSARALLEDSSIKLPRFQRKLSWSNEKNYGFCVSLFKNYPLGVMVMKKETTEEGNWRILLDGRQRRNVLKEMENPENIYLWAKKVLGILNADDPQQIAAKFWSHLDEYIGGMTEEEKREEGENILIADDGTIDEKDEDYISEHIGPDLLPLLRIIQTVHSKSGWRSGLTRPFEFQNEYDALGYFYENPDTGKPEIQSDRLAFWIRSQIGLDRVEKFNGPPDPDRFLHWLERSGKRKEGITKNRIETKIARLWDNIISVLRTVKILDGFLSERKVGYVYITKGTMADAMKIFEIINTKGETLTPIEILSSRFSWNKDIEHPHRVIVDKAQELYDEMDIPVPPSLVRWDRSATFMSRLKRNWIFGDLKGSKKAEKEKRLTLGFKLMTGYYMKSISKIKMEDLADNDSIPWGAVDLEEEINRMLKNLSNEDFFKFLNTWPSRHGFTLKSVMSEAIAINFLLIMLKDWEKKDKPTTPSSTKQKKFRKNAIILFDRLVYEYLMSRWKGSSDSRISRNLVNVENDSDYTDELFKPIASKDWKRLVDEIIDKGELNGETYVEDDTQAKNVAKVLLWYYYSLSNINGPDDPTVIGIDVDHIIPKNAFASVTDEDVKNKMNNIINLAYLPKIENIAKSNKCLKEISSSESPWLVSQIEKYEDIDEAQFPDFSEPSDAGELLRVRGEKIKAGLIDQRNRIISY